jgi:hypothetical protein
MQLVCPHCSQVLEITGAPPSFCAYCGHPLGGKARMVVPDTATFDPEAPTLSPSTEADGPTPIAASPPQQVGRYKLLRALGSGGMGTVYEAEDSSSGRHVALKLIAQEFASSKETAERFRQEGRLASAITHPRCVFVQAAEAVDGRSFIVMELMPGDTLKDLVERHGPLTVPDAIAKALDVIDGLLEAHRLEVIHRDVKPSNCFLQADGRVKVGDFGLAKSLVKKGSAHLTRTGTFLGTPYFASPEQVRGEPLDPQTDVYSVAATLYYILTGQPPFHGSDAASTLARIVADPAPPMREVRPDLPAALDRVVLKGLERDRKRRYQDLTEFREALVGLLPREVSLRGMGFRLGAYVVDYVLVFLTLVVLQLAVVAIVYLLSRDWTATTTLTSLIAELVAVPVWIAYFTVSESTWYCTVGKALLRLRVSQADADQLNACDPPLFVPVLVRSAVFVLLVHLGMLAITVLYLLRFLGSETGQLEFSLGGKLVAYLWPVVGVLILISTMRRGNGYRGVHELLSKTRVVQLPWPKKRPTPISTLGWFLYLKRSKKLSGEGSSHADNLPKLVGGFAIRGGMRLAPQETMLLGEDSSLSRKVAILLRPEHAAPLEAARRDLGRITRPRWIAGGKLKNEQWDAFLAPQGCPLPELIASERRLPWSEVRSILEQLSEELQSAAADGTTPAALNLEQIWVQQNGRVQLADWMPEATGSTPMLNLDATPEARGLDLLRRVAVLALEGEARAKDAPPTPIRAPLPEHARQILDRLLGVTQPYEHLADVRADLAVAGETPAEVDATLRAGQLAVLAAALVPSLAAMFLLGVAVDQFLGESLSYTALAWTAILPSLLIPMGWLLWIGLFRGGFSFPMMGLSLVNGVGQPPSLAQCVLRSTAMWLPVVLLAASAYLWPVWIDERDPKQYFIWAWLGCWAAVGLTFVIYLALVLMYPSRSGHDALADTYVVPR